MRKYKKIIKKIFLMDRGTSLIEIMIALGLLGTISVGVMRMVENMTKSQKTFETSLGITHLYQEIREVLAIEVACNETFKSTNFSSDFTITEIKDSAGNIRFVSSTTYEQGVVVLKEMKISDIVFDTVATQKAGTYNLNLIFEKKSSLALGSKEVTRKFKVNLITDLSNNFISCSSNEVISNDLVGEVVCNIMGDGYVVADTECDPVSYPGILGLPAAKIGADKSLYISQEYLASLFEDLDTRYIQRSDGVNGQNTAEFGLSSTDIISFKSQVNAYANFSMMSGAHIIMSSDRRLKKNIVPLKNVLAKLDHLRGVRFSWRKSGKKDIGLIAQEVKKSFPKLVSRDSITGKYMINYSLLPAITIQAIKELKAENDVLKRDVQQMKNLFCQQSLGIEFCKDQSSE